MENDETEIGLPPQVTVAGRGKSVRGEPFELFNGIAYYAMDTRKHLNNGLSFKVVDRAEAEFTWDDAWASDLDLAWGGGDEE